MKTGYALVFLLSLLACSNRNNPQAVSEDFIYNYYQRADQQAGLKLSHGLAAEKLEDEIARLRGVRVPGQLVDEMPQIEYKPVGKESSSETEDEAQVLFNYKLTIKNRGTTTHTRNVVINTERINGRWKVVNFDEY